MGNLQEKFFKLEISAWSVLSNVLKFSKYLRLGVLINEVLIKKKSVFHLMWNTLYKQHHQLHTTTNCPCWVEKADNQNGKSYCWLPMLWIHSFQSLKIGDGAWTRRCLSWKDAIFWIFRSYMAMENFLAVELKRIWARKKFS